MCYLLALLIVSSSYAATIDQQLDAASDSLAAYQLRVQQLQSQVIATRLDSIAQADPTLAANQVRVIRSNDSAAVNVLLGHLSATNRRIAIIEVRMITPADLVTVKGDTLYMQWPAAEQALPVIAATLISP